MASVTIGGVLYTVSLPNFKAIRRAWPIIKAVSESPDDFAGYDAAFRLIAQESPEAIAAAITPDQLEEALSLNEMSSVAAFITDITAEMSPKGETEPAKEGASPSTETLTPSLSVSSAA